MGHDLNGAKETNRVLVIDDEAFHRELLAHNLSDAFEIIQAENGREALWILEQYNDNFRAIVLDLIMPVMDGIEFLQEYHKRNRKKQIPVIASTGIGSLWNEEKCRKLGVSEFVYKPYDIEQLRYLLENMSPKDWDFTLQMNTIFTRMWNAAAILEFDPLDDRLEITRVNPSFLDVFGKEARAYEIFNENLIHIFAPSDRDKLKRAVRKAAETGQCTNPTIQKKQPNGNTAWLKLRIHFIGHANSNQIYLVLIEDITKYKEIEKIVNRLEEAGRMIIH
ncbi:MAG: response regulator [Lachnospiraceae bacterium]